MDDEIIYTVNIQNKGKTWGGVATYTTINVQDVIPRELEPIDITYNKFTMKVEKIQASTMKEAKPCIETN